MYIKKQALEIALRVIEKMTSEQIERIGKHVTSEIIIEFLFAEETQIDVPLK